MLPALIFYALLFVGLFLIPAGLILVVLLFLEHERIKMGREQPIDDRLRHGTGEGSPIGSLRTRFPRLTGFIARRFALRDAWGLPATVALVVICAGIWLFLGLLHDISSKDPIVVLDTRLHNSVPLFRTPGFTRVMLVVTEFGSPVLLSLLCLGIILVALGRERRRLAATFALAIGGSTLTSVVLKTLINSPRPLDAIVVAHEASFPSGHMLSGAVIYGLLAALLLGSRVRDWLRAVGVALLLVLVVGIGLSRLYLGVHWPTDVLGSLNLALIVLASLFFFFHYPEPIRWVDTFTHPFNAGLLRRGGYCVLLFALVAAPVMASRTKFISAKEAIAAHAVPIQYLSTSLPPELSRWSEDLIGGRMEPVSLVLVGSVDEIVGAFTRAGWARADQPTPVRLLKEGFAALHNSPDPTGPATPAYFMNQPQSFTFEKPDAGAPTIRRRHHTRIWRTADCLAPDCRSIWVATASFDVGLELSHPLHLPTHRIAPAIDNERAFIDADLSRTGATRDRIVRISPPVRGKNAAGDPFWTDGKAFVLIMPSA